MKSLSCPNGHCPRSRKGGCWSHHSPRLLQDQMGKASSLPVPDLWEDVLLDNSGHLIIDSNTVAPCLMRLPALSVEGLNKSAIARVKRVAWNTVHRWLERAAAWCRRFNNRKIKGLSDPGTSSR